MRSNTSRVSVRWDEFDRLTKARGWNSDSECARQLGIHPSTIANLRRGAQRPGAFVINQMLTGLQATYASLFELEPADREVA